MLTPASRLDKPQSRTYRTESRCGTTRFALVTTDAPRSACSRCRLRGANGWFDDEIAIDFPSLHAAVERMRASFVAASTEGDHRRQLSAELHLVAARSVRRRHGAARRARSQICLACGGRGEIWSDPCDSVRRQRRSARPSSRAARRSAPRAGRRSICPLGFCSVRSAHARRSARRPELNRPELEPEPELEPGPGTRNLEPGTRTGTRNPLRRKPHTIKYGH